MRADQYVSRTCAGCGETFTVFCNQSTIIYCYSCEVRISEEHKATIAQIKEEANVKIDELFKDTKGKK
jgi:ribosomal protein S27E